MHTKQIISVALLAPTSIIIGGCQSGHGSVTQLSFESPQDAVSALAYAAESRDRAYGRSLFGPEAEEFSTGDESLDDFERAQFVAAINRQHELQLNADGSYDVLVGEAGVPFPAPIIEHDGRWMFDTVAGVERLADMRIGYNELRTIDVLRIIPAAQEEYRSVDRDGDGVREYAGRYESSPGERDGLYWPTEDDEPYSPMGQFHAQAEAPESEQFGYHGYFFKLLDQQAAGAPGGAQDYRDNAGNLVGGFAVLAYPAVYGETGIMTFQMGADGRVFERDLGASATRRAGQIIDAFDPSGWMLTED